MVIELEDWLSRVWVPYQKFVIVTSRAKLLIIEGPFQATDFLLVSNQFTHEWVTGSKISVKNGFIP